ncbi:MAG: Gfo/Idh/MocA family oxidoreductase [Planctomycetes bacterium]|nr:Gfo/Idh/MocA family oxidoreductase [Planctomycetota bacterium]
MSSELRIGIIGACDVAERHVAGLQRAGGVRLTALAEPVEARREAFARAHGIGLATGDYRLLLAARDVDAVLILTPHHLHARMALEAFEAGKHVICEKPMAPSLADCDRMLDAARAAGVAFHVTHSLREDFFYRTAIARVRAGALGRLIAGSFRWYTDEEARLNDPGHWKGTKDQSGGGVLVDGGCHVADLANAFFGRAARVQAFGAKLVARRPEVAEDTAAFSIEYESGALVSVLLSFTAGAAMRSRDGFGAGMTADLYGTAAHIEGGYALRDADFRRFCLEHRTGEPDLVHFYDGKGRMGDIDVSVVRALRGEAPPPLTAADARNAVAVVDAAYQSLAAGQAAEVDWRDEE